MTAVTEKVRDCVGKVIYGNECIGSCGALAYDKDYILTCYCVAFEEGHLLSPLTFSFGERIRLDLCCFILDKELLEGNRLCVNNGGLLSPKRRLW